MDQSKGLGKWAKPGAWNDLDFLEIDIGNFDYTNSQKKSNKILLMNKAHFSLWSILSAPLIVGMDLRNISNEIFNIITNKNAIDINQNYLNNAGDIIIEFDGITNEFREEYINKMMENNNQTQLFYKPLPINIGDGAFLFLNRNTTLNYSMSLEFNQLPLTNNHNDSLQCNALDIWSNKTFIATNFSATLLPMSVKFIKLSNCSSVSDKL